MARIMVVEDEPITAMDLEQMLVAIGHEVAAWSDAGEAAIEKAKEVDPDLVLMDIRLQGEMTGIEAAERIRDEARARGTATPVVFLTAFADKETVDSACRTSPYGYLVKPFTERSVAAAVQVALSRAEDEREVREREHFLSSALRSLGEALIAVDARGRIGFANAHALELFGAHERDLVGENARDAIPFYDDEELVDSLDLALCEGRVTTRRANLRTQGGARLDVTLSAAPVLGRDGVIIGGVLAFREDEDGAVLPLSSDEAAVSERFQHEINSPLTYNLGALSIAIREIDTLRAMRAINEAVDSARRGEEEETRLHRIESLIRSAHEGATRVAAVMREVRNSAFLELEQVPLKPADVLELAVGACAEELESVSLSREVHPSPMVRGNKWQLARGLADELRCALSGEVKAKSATLEIYSGADERGYAELRFTLRADDGALGRAPRAEAPNTEALAAHHAELEVRYVEGARVISLFIPPLGAREVALKDARRGTVLVVDDEPMVGRVLELMLNPHHDVTVVHSAASALELLEQGSGFDVVLCDVTMPEMTGQELYEHLLATHPEDAERVIFMSGGTLDPEGAAFLERMEGRRLDKPFRADQLVPLLEERVRAAQSAPRG